MVSLKQCVSGAVLQKSQHSVPKHKQLRKTQIILPGDSPGNTHDTLPRVGQQFQTTQRFFQPLGLRQAR